MSRQALIGFVFINILVSVTVVILLITLWPDEDDNSAASSGDEPAGREALVVTATSAPGEIPRVALEGTLDRQNRRIRTLEAAVAEAGLPPEVLEENSPTPTDDPLGIPTLNPSVLPPASSIGDEEETDGEQEVAGVEPTSTPDDGCERYYVVSGDNCAAIAAEYDVSLQELLDLNPAIDTECTNLLVGQEILIPSEFCKPPPTPTPSPTITRTPFDFPTFEATFVITNTPQPTAEDTEVQVRIIEIQNVGDVTSEVVLIQNQGGVVNMLGWILTDEQGNRFTFPDMLLQPGGIIRVFTRTGQNTPAALYWNETNPLWQQEEEVTLSDATGRPISSFIVGVGPQDVVDDTDTTSSGEEEEENDDDDVSE